MVVVFASRCSVRQPLRWIGYIQRRPFCAIPTPVGEIISLFEKHVKNDDSRLVVVTPTWATCPDRNRPRLGLDSNKLACVFSLVVWGVASRNVEKVAQPQSVSFRTLPLELRQNRFNWTAFRERTTTTVSINY